MCSVLRMKKYLFGLSEKETPSMSRAQSTGMAGSAPHKHKPHLKSKTVLAQNYTVFYSIGNVKFIMTRNRAKKYKIEASHPNTP